MASTSPPCRSLDTESCSSVPCPKLSLHTPPLFSLPIITDPFVETWPQSGTGSTCQGAQRPWSLAPCQMLHSAIRQWRCTGALAGVLPHWRPAEAPSSLLACSLPLLAPPWCDELRLRCWRMVPILTTTLGYDRIAICCLKNHFCFQVKCKVSA